VNVGTFIPKAHTPYQWSPQLDAETAAKKLNYIRDRLKPRGFKVGIHDPFVSYIEGIFSRGDERAGELALEAFTRGARLDAWTEFFKRSLWQELLQQNPGIPPRGIDEELPWDFLESGTGKGFLKNEWKKSTRQEITSPCIENCTSPCGICEKTSASNRKIVYNFIHDENLLHELTNNLSQPEPTRDPDTQRMLFSFSKTGKAIFLPHLSLIEVFSMAFVRSGLPVQYSRGFNPLPRLDIASPLSIGVSALAEIASADFDAPVDPGVFTEALNAALPQGIRVTRAGRFVIPGGQKKYSVSALLWGFEYAGGKVSKADEKSYRAKHGYGLVRLGVLADPALVKTNGAAGAGSGGTGYFELYQSLYQQV
jgi:hypothetical protein